MQLPISFATFDKGCNSSDILSIVISIAVFMSSAKITKNKVLNKNIFSTIEISNNIAIGINIIKTNIQEDIK